VIGARCSTVFCAVINPRARTARYSSAGHPAHCSTARRQARR
jgi:hypothetical protein